MMPDKLYLNKFMIRPGMLYPAEFPPDNPEWEYIRSEHIQSIIRQKIKELPEDWNGASAAKWAYEQILSLLN